MHSLSRSLGGLSPRLHHGTLSTIFLPVVIAFNAFAELVQKEQRLEHMAQAMDFSGPAALGEAILSMNARLGLPTGLHQLDVSPDIFPKIIEGALKDHFQKTNPRLATPADYDAMLGASM